VGKSSLINTLVGRKGLARISQTPGKTQMIHFFQVEDLFVLVDLPGYGYARVPDRVRKSWGPMVESYLGSRRTLRLVVFLLDIRRIPGGQDQQLKSWLEQKGIPVCFVVTKADKVSRGARGAQLRQIAETLGAASGEFLPFSAVTREGRPGLWRRIREAAEGRDGTD
jgi:GTP-binding protein